MKYTLMHKNIAVADVEIDEDLGYLEDDFYGEDDCDELWGDPARVSRNVSLFLAVFELLVFLVIQGTVIVVGQSASIC